VVGLSGFPARFRGRAGARWSQGVFDAAVHLTHVTDYKDRLGGVIDAWNTVDAQINLSLDRLAGPGLKLTLGVENMLDEDPHFYNGPIGYGFDQGQASFLGRVVSLQLTKRW